MSLLSRLVARHFAPAPATLTITYPRETRTVGTLRDLVTAKSIATKAKNDANDKLAADLKTVADDQKSVADATTADDAAAQALAQGIAATGPAGEAIDPNPDPATGLYTVYKTDASPQGSHTYQVPSLDAPLAGTIPTPVPPPPPPPTDGGDGTAPDAGPTIVPGPGDVTGTT